MTFSQNTSSVPVSIPTSLSVYSSVYLSVHLSVCVSVHLYISPPVCVFVSPSLWYTRPGNCVMSEERGIGLRNGWRRSTHSIPRDLRLMMEKNGGAGDNYRIHHSGGCLAAESLPNNRVFRQETSDSSSAIKKVERESVAASAANIVCPSIGILMQTRWKDTSCSQQGSVFVRWSTGTGAFQPHQQMFSWWDSFYSGKSFVDETLLFCSLHPF